MAILSALAFTACNYTDGLCYLQEDLDGSEGAGGGIIVPGGEGGFGDAPPTPQAADPEGFECNAVGGYSASLFLDLSDPGAVADPNGALWRHLSVQGGRDVGRRRDPYEHARHAQS
ncbi:MAG: hypothetical protein R3F14_30795 [Polyangiaceae bacterium]